MGKKNFPKIIKKCCNCEKSFKVSTNTAWKTKYCGICRKENERNKVKEYQSKHIERLNYCRRRWRYKKYWENVGKARKEKNERNKKDCEKLASYIVRKAFKKIYGIPKDLITDELIEKKRELMLLKRSLKQFKERVENEKN